jgi:CHAD domain-containing protein
MIPVEMKAKLLVPTTTDLRAIARLTHLGSYPLRPRGTVRLHSRYLDTPHLTLARHGVTVRLRRQGRQWEATVTWAGRVEGDVHQPPELTIALARTPALPFVPPPGPLRTHLTALAAGRPLAPILISEIHRRLFDVMPSDPAATPTPVAELGLDRVRLHAPQEGQPEATYCEVEVERRHGDRRDIATLARLLPQDVGRLSSSESEFARGLTLLYGSGIIGSSDQRVLGYDTTQTAVRRIVARQLHWLRFHDPGVRTGEDPEALHDMRVATRRLRAALHTFAGGMPPRLHARMTEELKWLGRLLGGVRDLDVQLAKLNGFTAAAPAGFRPALRRLHAYVEGERTRRRVAMLAGLDTARYFRLLIQLERFAYSRVAKRPRQGTAQAAIATAGRRAIKRAFRRLTKRGAKIQAVPRPEDLHALRIRAKRLRYLLEFLQELTGKSGRRLIKYLTTLQDLLGSYHDAVVGADAVRTYVESPGPPLPPASMVALGALVASELRLAEQKRADFENTWRRFTRKRTVDACHAVLRRVRSTQSPPPEPDTNSRGVVEEAGHAPRAPGSAGSHARARHRRRQQRTPRARRHEPAEKAV